MQQNRISTLDDWRRTAEDLARAHEHAAVRLTRRGYQLGIPAVSLSAVVGTTVFATLETNAAFWIKLFVALMSISVAILTSLQAFLRYGERAEKHRTTGAEYKSIVREVRTLLDEYNASDKTMTDDQARSSIALVRKRFDELDIRAPELSEVDRVAEALHGVVPSVASEPREGEQRIARAV